MSQEMKDELEEKELTSNQGKRRRGGGVRVGDVCCGVGPFSIPLIVKVLLKFVDIYVWF